jgi:hypothetical protein
MSVAMYDGAMIKRWSMRAFVGAGLLGLSWCVGVQPLKREVLASEAALAAQSAEIAEYQLSLATQREDPDTAIAGLQKRLDEITTRSRQSADASALYESVGRLADTCGVRVERIEPRSSAGRRDAASGVNIEANGFSFEVSGGFDGITKFLSRIEGEGGISKVTGVHLTRTSTSEEPTRITGILETSHFRVVEATENKDGGAK